MGSDWDHGRVAVDVAVDVAAARRSEVVMMMVGVGTYWIVLLQKK